jgi:hypothetical protein
MRVALPPGVAGARGGKVLTIVSSRFPIPPSVPLYLLILRVSPKAQAQATNKPYMVFSEDRNKCFHINDALNRATGF